MTSNTVSVEKRRKGRKSDMSVDSDAKSARERYIRDAAMVIMVNEGTWNICVSCGRALKYQFFFVRGKNGRTRLNGSGVCNRIEYSE
jgi:hypothetical protein